MCLIIYSLLYTCTLFTLYHSCVLPPSYRAELSSEDDLSPDSDSDTMDVDSTNHETARDKRQGSASAGKANSVAGALVPETTPQFAVSWRECK